ncbi:hypothetical protein MLD38_031769 [Melastoma candidum]|uniref:Uncharacterized protein n=1 Tax=Melastoma candidum TaxID=119954 RepID=A0ACB9MRV7_9MYRT|nr:hypothetical protein MLD38_031769 [Melastoma candidum]
MFFSSYFADRIAQAIPRRGYAAAVETAAKGRAGGAVKRRPVKEEVTWMPDPKTGFFRPGNRRDEMDAAELRAVMLRRKNSRPTAPR